MSNFNHCSFTGRIVQPPELKVTPSGKNVCTFSLAVENGYGDNKKVIYPNFVAWGGQAEFISKLPKGAKVSVIAQYDIRDWQTTNGEKRKSHEFIVREFESHEKRVTAEEAKANIPPALTSDRVPTESTPPSYTPVQGSFEEIDPDDELPF